VRNKLGHAGDLIFLFCGVFSHQPIGALGKTSMGEVFQRNASEVGF